MVRFTSWIAIPILYLTSACASYDVAWSSVRLRYDATKDTLHLLEQQHGITCGDQGVATAWTAMRAALDGRRRFPAEGGFLSLDLDRNEFENWSDEERSALLSFAAHVQVVEAHAYRERGGALSFVRHSLVTNLSGALLVVNDWLNREALESNHGTPGSTPVPKFPIFDAETRAAFARAHAEGHAWLSVRDGAIELDVPMTEANAGRCLAALARQEAKDFDSLLEVISSVQVSNGHARLRFCAPPVATVTFEGEANPCETDDEVIDALRGQGVVLGDEASAEEIVRRFEARPATPAADGSPK